MVRHNPWVLLKPAPRRVRASAAEWHLGIRTEREHTRSHPAARLIAAHHLAEHPRYYSKVLLPAGRSARRTPGDTMTHHLDPVYLGSFSEKTAPTKAQIEGSTMVVHRPGYNNAWEVWMWDTVVINRTMKKTWNLIGQYKEKTHAVDAACREVGVACPRSNPGVEVGTSWQSPEGPRAIRQIMERNGRLYAAVTTGDSSIAALEPLNQLEKIIAVESANARSRDAARAHVAAEEDAEKRLSEPFDDFLATLSPAQAAKAREALLKQVRSGGVFYPRYKLIAKLIAEGFVYNTAKARLEHPEGGFYLTKDLSQTAMNYARFRLTHSNPGGQVTVEHAARIRDPKSIRPETYRSKTIKAGLRLILGKLRTTPMRKPKKGVGSRKSDPMVVQAVRFNRLRYTAAQARAWCVKHGLKVLKFEPATASSQVAMKRAAVKRKATKRVAKRRRAG